MPIATSSMYHNAAGQQNPRRKQARQLWGDFRLYAVKARQGMQDRRNMALQDARREWQIKPGRSHQEREQQRENIMKLHERQHYLEMREEWQRMLHSNGLQHEDWGEVTSQEMMVIRQVLGPDDIEDEEEEENRIGSRELLQHPPLNPPDFSVPGVAAQPLSQSVSHQSQASYSSQSSLSSSHHSYAAPSLASRSQNTSSASYARVDPSNFTDDERDDFPIPFSARRAPPRFAAGSIDEERGIPVPIPSYKTWAPSASQQPQPQLQPQLQPQPQSQPQPALVTQRTASNPGSLSSSPVDAPSAPRSHHQPSSSLSSSAHFPSHVPSSLSKSIAVEDDEDRIFTSVVNGTASSSATGVKSKSKLRSGYIGPQVTTNDSENEADADFASMSKADQIAAYEKFKREARIQKILEFHEEAVKIDIELADKINGGSDTTFDANGHGEVHNGYDKAWVARLIAQHEQDMLKLRAKKEEERKQLVHDERNRMMAEIKKGGRSVGSAAASASTGAKKGWGVSSSTTAKPALKGNINTTTSTVTSSSSAFAAANRTPIAPSQKPRTPAAPSPGIGAGFMNLDELQNVFENVPDMGLDTAFQITQLLNSEDGTGGLYHDQQHDQEWGAPQLRHTPSTNDFTTTTSGPRKRTDSVSVLDESRFGTISAKNKQRRGTITVSTANTANESSNGGNGFWKPQAQPPSPEESEAMTDKFAKLLLTGGGGGGVGVGGPPSRMGTSAAAAHQGNDDDDWVGWGSKPTASIKTTNGVPKATSTSGNTGGGGSAWSTKKPAQTAVPSSSAVTNATGGWGSSVKKTFGFNAGAGATSVGGGWETEQWSQEDDGRLTEPEEEEEEEEEEGPEEELIKPSPFNPRGLQYQQQQQAAQKKPSSLLTDMMAKGKNAVAGAVGAAIGMNAPSPAIPPPTTTSQARKFGAQASAAAIPTPPPITTSTTAGGKKAAAKKGRQTANKKVTPTSLMEPEDDSPEFESQPQLLTPRAAASSTKFTSSFGTSNNNNNSSSVFGFGSQTSRNAASASAAGGMWDDMISTTPKPASGLSNALGAGGGHSLGAGVRRPSGLHHQVWNAGEEREEEAEEGEQEEEEEEQEEEEEGEVEEDGWNMPGSLATRGGPFGVNAGIKKFGSTTTSNAKASPATKKNSPQPTMTTNAWGQWETTPSTASTTSSSKLTPTVSSAKVASTKKSALSRKNYHHQVTMEEIPDESDQLNRSPSNFLSPDSRIIMEPRPSKPPVVFDGIIQFGGESSSPEDTRHHQQHRPLPKPKGGKQRTMASSPLVNAGQGGEEIDEAWFQRAALQLQQGTEEGNKLFGGSGGSGGGGTPASSSSQAARNGINIPSRGPGGPTNKSNNPWSTTPSSFTSSSNQGVSMSGSFKDSSSLSGGPPPKSTSSLSSNTTSTTTTTSSSKSSLNNAWGSGLSSSPNTGTGLGFGKASNTKAKPTTSTSTGFGAGGFAWGSGSPSSFGNAGSNVDDNPWGGGGGGGNGQSEDGWQEEKTEEELERERNLIDSKKRLQDLFGDSTTSSAAKPVPPKLATGGALKTAAARAKALREQQEREERERQEQMEREEEETREEEEREAREQAEREAQEKATKEKGAKEREVSAAAATKTKTGGVKKGKGRKR